MTQQLDVGAALDGWLVWLGASDSGTQANLSAHTIKLYRSAAGSFRRWWALEARTLDNTTLATWVRALRADGHADRTVQGYAQSLTNFVEYLAEHELAPLSPDLTKRHLRHALPAYNAPTAPEVADLRRLVGWFDGATAPAEATPAAERAYLNKQRNSALLHLLFSTGMRIGEALALDANDLRGRGGALKDRIEVLGKGRRQRRVFIRPHAKKALGEYVRARQSAFPDARPLFISHGPRGAGGRLNPSTAWRIVTEAACRLADTLESEGDAQGAALLRVVTPHSFRHFVATWLLNEGAMMSEVSQLLGHSSTTVTEQFYARHNDDRLQEMHDTFAPDPD
jgi:integrase/recombinase XerD